VEIVNIHKAKTHLSALIARVLKGEKIVIAKDGRPVVTLEQIKGNSAPRIPGRLRGKIKISKDFDDLPPGFEDFAQ